jgi:hypothetical protein
VGSGAIVEIVFAKKRLCGYRAEFDANNLVSSLAQPDHVDALAAKRNKDFSARRSAGPGPELVQLEVSLLLMKSNLILVPTLMPEIFIHI